MATCTLRHPTLRLAVPLEGQRIMLLMLLVKIDDTVLLFQRQMSTLIARLSKEIMALRAAVTAIFLTRIAPPATLMGTKTPMKTLVTQRRKTLVRS